MQDINKKKRDLKKRRQFRTRAKISGTAQKPRLNIFRSLKHLYIQVIDDTSGKTLVSVKDSEVDTKGLKPTALAEKVGQEVAKKVIKAGIKTVVFDRAGYKFHGRVKAVAEGARKGGLEF